MSAGIPCVCGECVLCLIYRRLCNQAGDPPAKLSIELIPSPNWGANLRKLLTRSAWDKLRFFVYERAGGVCEVCGDKGTNQGRRHDLEAHEIWEYNDNALIQRLAGVVALCPRCHAVKHMGRTVSVSERGAQEARAHLASVNGWDEKITKPYEWAAFFIHEWRSRHVWSIDMISIMDFAEGVEAPLTYRDIDKMVAKWRGNKRHIYKERLDTEE